MSGGIPIGMWQPSPEDIARQRDNGRKSTICSVAASLMQVHKMTGSEMETPRAVARKCFDQAEAYWDELQARGLEIAP